MSYYLRLWKKSDKTLNFYELTYGTIVSVLENQTINNLPTDFNYQLIWKEMLALKQKIVNKMIVLVVFSNRFYEIFVSNIYF